MPDLINSDIWRVNKIDFDQNFDQEAMEGDIQKAIMKAPKAKNVRKATDAGSSEGITFPVDLNKLQRLTLKEYSSQMEYGRRKEFLGMVNEISTE